MDILLYSSELFLEFLALIALRWKMPKMERPFRVPGGWAGAIIVTVLPMSLAVIVALASMNGHRADLYQVAAVPAVVLSGFLIYFARRKTQRERILRP